MMDHAFRPNAMVPISCAVCGNERRFHTDAPPPARPETLDLSIIDDWPRFLKECEPATLKLTTLSDEQQLAIRLALQVLRESCERKVEPTVAAIRALVASQSSEIARLREDANRWKAAYQGLRDKRNRIDRINEDDSPGGLDEIVGVGLIHVERMDDDHVWASLGGHSFDFHASREGRKLSVCWQAQDIDGLRKAVAARSSGTGGEG